MGQNKKNNKYAYLLFLPIYLLGFYIIEQVDLGQKWHEIHCFLDDLIPFNEYFIIPYYSWHVLSIIVIFYTLRYEEDNYRKLMKFFIICATITFTIYLIFPSSLNLRPQTFTRENLMTAIVKNMYTMDTPTNVMPSMHIIGSLGLLFTSWNTRGKDSPLKKALMLIAVIFICSSTVILKQHSVIDVIAAIPVSLIGWAVCFNEYKVAILKKYLRGMMTPKGFFTNANLSAIAFIAPIAFLSFFAGGSRWVGVVLLVYCFRTFFSLMYDYITVNSFGRVIGMRWYSKLATAVTYIYISGLFAMKEMSPEIQTVMSIICIVFIVFSTVLNANDNLKLHWGERYRENQKQVLSAIFISIIVITFICYIVR